jgi:outer membrane lipopolysaccharide assembly protein LptE/RlpB
MMTVRVARPPSPAKTRRVPSPSSGSGRLVQRLWVEQRFRVVQRFSAALKHFSWRKALAPVGAASLLLLTACGYHTAGHAVTLPTDLNTIAIPTFANNTETYKIEQRLTAAVVSEFTTRTHYHILNSANDAADATLRGTVFSTYTAPLTYDSKTGRVASALITVSMKVSLTDRHGKVLYQNPAYIFREQYEVSQQLNSFFEEDSPAFERLSRDFARTLVSNVLEGF